MRSYAFYAPANLVAGAPLVLALHGSMGNAERMRRATGYGFERLADRHGFVVAYPQGYDHHWNDCRKEASFAARRLGSDDVGYLRPVEMLWEAEPNKAVLFAPRIWGLLPPAARADRRAVEVRYVFDARDLDLVAARMGWRRLGGGESSWRSTA